MFNGFFILQVAIDFCGETILVSMVNVKKGKGSPASLN